MRYIGRLAQTLCNIQLDLAAWILLVLTLLMTINVLARYLFNSPLIFADEISVYMFLAIVFFGLEYAWSKREHIQIEFILQALPKKARRYLDGLLLILMFGFCFILLWGTLSVVIGFYQQGVHAFTVLNTFLFWPALIMPIGMFFFVGRLLVDLYNYFSKKEVKLLKGE